MVYFKKHSTGLLLAFSCTLAACSSQPSYQGQSTEQSLEQYTNWEYTQSNAQQVNYITDLVDVDGLDSLIEQAIANNPSFNQVHVALKLAYAQRDVTAANQWFSIDAGFDAQRSESDGTQYSSSVGVSWEADIWQKIADNVAAQDMTIASNQAAYGQTNKNLLMLEQSAIQAEQNLMTKLSSDKSEITSLQVISSSDTSGTVSVELLDDGAFTASEFAQEWQRLAASPEGSKKLQILATRKMVDNFKVELKAWDDETVMAAGALFKEHLQNTAGVNGIDDNLNPGQPQLKFTLNAQGRALGMDTASLSKQVLQAFGGAVVQRYQRNKDEVKVRVRYPENARQTPADIMQSRIRLPDGTVVPLVNVATINSEYQHDEITRIDGLRAIYLSAQVDKSVIAPNELVADLKRDLIPELTQQFPTLNIHFAGEAEEQDETTGSMLAMFIAALLVIYVLLAIPLKSYVQPLLIMVAIPFGVVGAILGHWWNDLTISILSLNGILALSGVVVNDSLLLVSRFNELTKEEDMNTHDAIVESCTSRLRAVLLTSITTYAGLVPLLSETSIQAQFLIPAAASLGYGILFATVITLILIPALLMIQTDAKRGIDAMLKSLGAKNKTQETAS